MYILASLAVFIFGLLIGSFLNVVIYRYGTGVTIVNDRSMCFSCGKTLAWYELIPVVSFLLQGGKCRACKSAISWQYPIVEVLTGVIFLSVVAHAYGAGLLPLAAFYYLVVFSFYLVISVYDLKHKIIPNGLVYTLIVLTAIPLFVDPSFTHFVVPSAWRVAAGPLYALPFALLWFVSKGAWMGLGDAKLAWAIGWLLGLNTGGIAIIFGFWIGAVFGLVAMAVNKVVLSSRRGRLTMKSEIPFGPFLAVGTLIAWLYGITFSSFVTVFAFSNF